MLSKDKLSVLFLAFDDRNCLKVNVISIIIKRSNYVQSLAKGLTGDNHIKNLSFEMSVFKIKRGQLYHISI